MLHNQSNLIMAPIFFRNKSIKKITTIPLSQTTILCPIAARRRRRRRRRRKYRGGNRVNNWINIITPLVPVTSHQKKNYTGIEPVHQKLGIIA